MVHGSALDVEVTAVVHLKRFDKEYAKLGNQLRQRADAALEKLLQNPRPHGIRFEQLSGYADPLIYTIRVDGNFRISLEMDGTTAYLRRVADHDEIYRAP